MHSGANRRTLEIAAFIREFAECRGWRVQEYSSKVSESRYMRLHKAAKCVQVRVSFHAKRNGWKTVMTRKQAQDFLKRALDGG
jgi:hypothetical protein